MLKLIIEYKINKTVLIKILNYCIKFIMDSHCHGFKRCQFDLGDNQITRLPKKIIIQRKPYVHCIQCKSFHEDRFDQQFKTPVKQETKIHQELPSTAAQEKNSSRKIVNLYEIDVQKLEYSRKQIILQQQKQNRKLLRNETILAKLNQSQLTQDKQKQNEQIQKKIHRLGKSTNRKLKTFSTYESSEIKKKSIDIKPSIIDQKLIKNYQRKERIRTEVSQINKSDSQKNQTRKKLEISEKSISDVRKKLGKTKLKVYI